MREATTSRQWNGLFKLNRGFLNTYLIVMVSNFFLRYGYISSPKNISLFWNSNELWPLKGGLIIYIFTVYFIIGCIDVKLANIKVGQLIKLVWKDSSVCSTHGFNITSFLSWYISLACNCDKNLYMKLYMLLTSFRLKLIELNFWKFYNYLGIQTKNGQFCYELSFNTPIKIDKRSFLFCMHAWFY